MKITKRVRNDKLREENAKMEERFYFMQHQ